MAPLLTLVNNDRDNHEIPYDIIEVLAFNFDAKGGALCRCYIGSHHVLGVYRDDLLDVILGLKTVEDDGKIAFLDMSDADLEANDSNEE